MWGRALGVLGPPGITERARILRKSYAIQKPDNVAQWHVLLNTGS